MSMLRTTLQTAFRDPAHITRRSRCTARLLPCGAQDGMGEAVAGGQTTPDQ
jgi:hypothetical protein